MCFTSALTLDAVLWKWSIFDIQRQFAGAANLYPYQYLNYEQTRFVHQIIQYEWQFGLDEHTHTLTLTQQYGKFMDFSTIQDHI